MEETYTIVMALFDFIPNSAFWVGTFFLVKLSFLLRGKPCARMLMAGTALVFLGGILKATWQAREQRNRCTGILLRSRRVDIN